MLGSKLTKLLSFIKQKIGFSSNFTSLFSVMRHNSFVFFQLKFYILSTKGAYQSTNLVKFHVHCRKSEILHFDGLEVLTKKLQNSYLSMTLKSDAKFTKKLTCGFIYDMRSLVNFHLITQKSENFTSMSSFCSKYIRFEPKNTNLSWHWTMMQNLNKPWPCCFKISMWNWVNFHWNTSLKNCNWLFLFKECYVSARKCQRNYVSWH